MMGSIGDMAYLASRSHVLMASRQFSTCRISRGPAPYGAAALVHGAMYALRRAQAIRAIEKSHASHVITTIHRQEKRSIFGFYVSRHIDLEDAQTIIAAIKDTPDDMPIDLVVHTPARPAPTATPPAGSIASPGPSALPANAPATEIDGRFPRWLSGRRRERCAWGHGRYGPAPECVAPNAPR